MDTQKEILCLTLMKDCTVLGCILLNRIPNDYQNRIMYRCYILLDTISLALRARLPLSTSEFFDDNKTFNFAAIEQDLTIQKGLSAITLSKAI